MHVGMFVAGAICVVVGILRIVFRHRFDRFERKMRRALYGDSAFAGLLEPNAGMVGVVGVWAVVLGAYLMLRSVGVFPM